jgi:phage tail tape-measure protein
MKESVVDDREKEEVGKVTGSVAGALGGVRLAAAVLPIPVVGPFAGAVVGGVVGSELGRRLSKAVFNGAAAFVDTLREGVPGAAAVTADPGPDASASRDVPAGTDLTSPTPSGDGHAGLGPVAPA